MADGQDRVSQGSSFDKTPSLVDLFRSPNEILCEFGDVTLIADDGFHPILKIRVSSCILSTASKVFTALFSKNFAEGQALRKDAADGKTIELHMGDRPADLLALCKLLHFRGDVWSMAAQSFFGLALIIDKYDCVESLRQFTHSVLMTVKEDSWLQTDSHIYYIAAAFVLDDANGFRELTQKLVLASPRMFLHHYDERINVLPSMVLPSISAQRAFVFQDLTRHLAAFMEDYTNSAYALEVPNYSRKLARILTKRSLLPLNSSTSSLQHYLDTMSSIHVPVMQQDVYPRSATKMLPARFWPNHESMTLGWNIRHHGTWADVNPESPNTGSPTSSVFTAPHPRIEPPSQEDLDNLTERFRNRCAGLCLDCVKGNDSCRVGHRELWGEEEELPKDMFWAYSLDPKSGRPSSFNQTWTMWGATH